MTHNGFDLSAAARQEMINEGFQPDFPPEAIRQLDVLKAGSLPLGAGVRDLRSLLWSSIDNDSSRDQADGTRRVRTLRAW